MPPADPEPPASARTAPLPPPPLRPSPSREKRVWTIGETVLGPAILAANPRGVCFLQFGTDTDMLFAELRAAFPKAALHPADLLTAPPLLRWFGAFKAYPAGEGPHPRLPLDLEGTILQLKVWRFLLALREGETVTAGEIAYCIDEPRALRGVASACRNNPVAVLIPCHRLVRNRKVRGPYRWGDERKQALLSRENAGPPRPKRFWRSAGLPTA